VKNTILAAGVSPDGIARTNLRHAHSARRLERAGTVSTVGLTDIAGIKPAGDGRASCMPINSEAVLLRSWVPGNVDQDEPETPWIWITRDTISHPKCRLWEPMTVMFCGKARR